jgi:mannose-6-phosphate isomerase-like protein (cupin superfamily)
MTSRPLGPINLTEAAERTFWSEARWVGRALAGADGLALEIRALDDAEEGCRSPSGCDDVYVVVSGYGVLRCGEEAVEFTASDVLVAPAGTEHRLERLDGAFRLWRISLGRLPGAGSSG